MRAWEEFIQRQEVRFGKNAVDLWLRSLSILRFDARNLYLSAQNFFQVKWFEEHLREEVRNYLCNNNGEKVAVHLSLSFAPSSSQKNSIKIKKEQGKGELSSLFIEEPFLSEFSLTHFRFGKSNPLLKAFVQHQVMQKKRDDYGNPIYIYGVSGCGKSHLMQAMGQRLKKEGKGNICYVTGETFVKNAISAFRFRALPSFRKKYRNADVFFLDGVESLSKKFAIQEEFFHLFNCLHERGALIFLSAQIRPQELQKFQARLINRFSWGMMIQIDSLTREELQKMLWEKASYLGSSLDEKTLSFFLLSFSNTKRMVRALERWLFCRDLTSHQGASGVEMNHLDSSLIQREVEPFLKEEFRASISPEKIVDVTAEVINIPKESLLGKERKRECALARKIAIFLCHRELHLSSRQLGEFFGRNHSTVLHAIQMARKQYEKRENFFDQVTAICNQLHRLKKVRGK